MTNTSITSLKLYNFRNHTNLTLYPEQYPVTIVGANGTGKTNVLEAISLLSPGKGLRNADLRHIPNINSQNQQSWSINTTISNNNITSQITMGRSQDKPLLKINNKNHTNKLSLPTLLNVLWMTPQMDTIFLDSKTERRKFLDRLTFIFHPNHARHIIQYENAKSERMNILKKGIMQDSWLSSIEKIMAHNAAEISIARLDTLTKVQTIIHESDSSLPLAKISLSDTFNNETESKEDITLSYQKQFHTSRTKDTYIKQTSVGPHKSDLCVLHQNKNMPAHLTSTGEQKLLLLSIIIAVIKAKQNFQNISAIILLDDVLSHLDPYYQDQLISIALETKTQIWFTHTTTMPFERYKSSLYYHHL